MTQKRKWISFLLVVCLLVSLFPAGAMAADNGKAIQLGASAIETGDTVYFGTYDNSTVSWNVLSTEGNGGEYEDSEGGPVNESDALFLLSDTLWSRTAFNSIYRDGNSYSGSTLQATLLGYVSSNFTGLEQTAILKTTKAASNGTTTLNSYNYTDAALSGDTLFALSVDELVEYLGYGDRSNWSAGVSSGWWWLRSVPSVYSYSAGVVRADSYPGINYVNGVIYARPAFNLNMNSVLFTSAAENGKDGMTGELSAVSSYTDSEWKLTLKDSSRNFAVESVTVSGENTLTVAYSGATTGTNEYISAIVTDSDGNITYYGRIKSMAGTEDASGEVSITLPDNFDASTDTLYLFSEHYNTDNSTDYASELQAVYTVTNNLTNITTDNSNTYCSTTSNYTATLSTSGNYSLPDSITVTAGGTTLTAEADYTYSSSTGALTIYASAITGDIVITAQAVLVDTGSPSTGTTDSKTDSSAVDTTGSSSTSTLSASSGSSLPTTGDTTNPRLALYAAITSALAVSAIASGFILRRRNRYQGAHFRRI